MTTRPLIALTGYPGSGKDTVGAILQRLHDYHCVAFAFAVKLQVARGLAAMEGALVYPERVSFVLERLEEGKRLEANTHWTRQIVQATGQGMKELFGPNYWVELVAGSMRAGYVFTDCRFPQEVEALRAAGAVFWRNTRPGTAPTGDVSDSYIDTIAVDYGIDNDGTLEDLEKRVKVVYERTVDRCN